MKTAAALIAGALTLTALSSAALAQSGTAAPAAPAAPATPPATPAKPATKATDAAKTAAPKLKRLMGEVVSVRRIRLADGEPVAIEHAVLRRESAATVLDADLESGSLHEALVGADLVPTRGHATIASEPAEADEAPLLDVVPGWPLLVERRLIVDQDGRPLELTESRYAAGRYALDVDFVVEREEPS